MVVERLEDVLAMAKEGKLSSVAIAYVYRDGSSGAVYSRIPSLPALIGSVSILTARLQKIVLDKNP